MARRRAQPAGLGAAAADAAQAQAALASEALPVQAPVPASPDSSALQTLLAGERCAADLHFHGASLPGALISGVRFNRVHFEDCSFAGALFSHADLRGCSFTRCDLSRAVLRGADLRGTRLIDCRLELADLSGARLDGALLRRTSLRAAQLTGTHFGAFELLDESGPLRFSDLSVTRLEDVDISYAVLQGVDFQGVSLTTVRGLKESLLIDCSLQNCDLPPVLDGAPMPAERIAGGILGAGLLGGDRRLWQELPALMTRHRVDYWQRLEPHFLTLPPPVYPWPISQLVLAFHGREYTTVLKTQQAWGLRARRSYAALKNAYLEQSNTLMASRLAYNEKELERRGLGVSTLDELLRLFKAALLLVTAAVGLDLLLVHVRLGLLLLLALILILALRHWRESAAILRQPRNWIASLRCLPQWVIDLPRRTRLRSVYEAVLRRDERPSPVADLIYGAVPDIPRSRLEQRLIAMAQRGPGLLLALLLCLPAMLATLLVNALGNFGLRLGSFLLTAGRGLSASFWMLSCGYGERPERVVATALASVVIFAAVYLSIGVPVYESGGEVEHYRFAWEFQIKSAAETDKIIHGWYNGWRHALLLSAQAFTGMGFSMLGERKHELPNLIGVAECAWGLFLSALLIWSLGRKIQAY